MSTARELEDKQRWDPEEKMFEIEEDFWRKNKIGIEGPIAQELFPGIPNEVTLAAITTKFSWREVHVLQSLSRDWYSAIRDRLVYESKVHFHLTETFILLGYGNGSLALHCLRDNSYFDLPNISHDHGGTNGYHESVTMDGKVYVLGGVFDCPSDKVYMLDLAAGQRSWTQVASMHIARSGFACSVMGGKIYVCGGECFYRSECFYQSLRESEVYDPKKNVWSLIKPMCSLTSCGKSEPVGDRLFVYNTLYNPKKDFVEVYYPVKDEWRKVGPFARPSDGTLFGGKVFETRGRLYLLNNLGIWEYSLEGNSWTRVCSHSNYPVLNFEIYCVLVVEDNLLASGCFFPKKLSRPRFAVLRSIGFDTTKEKLEWREERGWGPDCAIYCSYTVHL